jgi:hypothetical protein
MILYLFKKEISNIGIGYSIQDSIIYGIILTAIVKKLSLYGIFKLILPL